MEVGPAVPVSTRHAHTMSFKIVYKSSTSISPLAGEVSAFTGNQLSFFAACLLNPIQKSGSCNFISIGNQQNMFLADSLIIRPCYEHLLPQIHNRMLDGFYHTAITGTPGIGKSVFGVLMVRHFVLLRKRTVLYWEEDNVYIFSFDKGVRDFFGLSKFAEYNEKELLYAGYWHTAETRHWPSFFRSSFDMVVIHDPKQSDTRFSSNQSEIKHLIYILSHGHSLISHWATKGCGPYSYDYMPLWSKDEVLRSLPLLKCQDPEASPIGEKEVDKLYYTFGGCIRGWLAQGEVWAELEAKNQGTGPNTR